MRVCATELIARTQNTTARVELRRAHAFMRGTVCNLEAALLSDGLDLCRRRRTPCHGTRSCRFIVVFGNVQRAGERTGRQLR